MSAPEFFSASGRGHNQRQALGKIGGRSAEASLTPSFSGRTPLIFSSWCRQCHANTTDAKFWYG
jgi:hypothetical protein